MTVEDQKTNQTFAECLAEKKLSAPERRAELSERLIDLHESVVGAGEGLRDALGVALESGTADAGKIASAEGAFSEAINGFTAACFAALSFLSPANDSASADAVPTDALARQCAPTTVQLHVPQAHAGLVRELLEGQLGRIREELSPDAPLPSSTAEEVRLVMIAQEALPLPNLDTESVIRLEPAMLAEMVDMAWSITTEDLRSARERDELEKIAPLMEQLKWVKMVTAEARAEGVEA